MNVDYTSYRRGASVSIMGMVVQVILAIVLAAYGVIATDRSAIAASLMVAIGILAWLAMAIAFDQHRRERIEAMEQEALGTAGVGSVFEKGADEFRPAARRLVGIYKFFIPIVSIVMATGYIGLGIWRFKAALSLTDLSIVGPSSSHKEVGLAMSVIVAVLGFFLARYAAGMSRQKVWTNLRGGAAVAGGAAVVGLAIAVGLVVQIFSQDFISRVLQVVIPGLMVVLGAEIVINFLLNLYRPRKSGEIPRPAFDSRLLSLVAAPDTVVKSIGDAISYQLGYDVTGNWFYQLVSKLVGPMVALGLLILVLLSSIAIVQPHQAGIITRFGKNVRSVGPGPHFKLPWPIEKLEVPVFLKMNENGRMQEVGNTTTGLRVIELGSSPSIKPGPILWTTEHAGTEVFFIVQPPTSSHNGGSSTDLAQTAVECSLSYEVSDVAAYEMLAPASQRDELLRGVAQRELVHFFSHVPIDQLLGPDRVGLGGALKKRISAAFAKLNSDANGARGSGVNIVALHVAKLHPHMAVASAYESVVEADQKATAKFEGASAAKIKKLSAVAGTVDRAEEILAEIAASAKIDPADEAAVRAQDLKIRKLMESATGAVAEQLAKASAGRWTKYMSERGLAARYAGLLESYNASPDLFRASLFFDSWKEAMSKSIVYVTSDDLPNLRIDADVKIKDTGVDVFRADTTNTGK